MSSIGETTNTLFLLSLYLTSSNRSLFSGSNNNFFVGFSFLAACFSASLLFPVMRVLCRDNYPSCH